MVNNDPEILYMSIGDRKNWFGLGNRDQRIFGSIRAEVSSG